MQLVLFIGLLMTFQFVRTVQLHTDQEPQDFFNFRARESLSNLDIQRATYQQVVLGELRFLTLNQ
jgi:hypothetical protein